MQINKLAVAKNATQIVVAHCVGATIGTIINQNTHVETTAEKAKIAVGSYTIGAMVAMKSEAYVSDRIDSLVRTWKKANEKTEQKKTA